MYHFKTFFSLFCISLSLVDLFLNIILLLDTVVCEYSIKTFFWSEGCIPEFRVWKSWLISLWIVEQAKPAYFNPKLLNTVMCTKKIKYKFKLIFSYVKLYLEFVESMHSLTTNVWLFEMKLSRSVSMQIEWETSLENLSNLTSSDRLQYCNPCVFLVCVQI